MEWLKGISDICSYLSIIGTLLAVALKGAAYLRRMNEKIDRLEGYSHNDYMNTLKLTIMSEEIPLEERLIAGEKYVQEGGNGAIKAKYRLLQEEYEKRNGDYQHG